MSSTNLIVTSTFTATIIMLALVGICIENRNHSTWEVKLLCGRIDRVSCLHVYTQTGCPHSQQ